MVVTGGDEDSVSTLGNPLSPAKIRQQVASSLLPAAPGASWGDSASMQSGVTMDTRLSAMEQTMQTLAEDMEKRFEDSMDCFFNRMQLVKQASEQEQQPPWRRISWGAELLVATRPWLENVNHGYIQGGRVGRSQIIWRSMLEIVASTMRRTDLG